MSMYADQFEQKNWLTLLWLHLQFLLYSITSEDQLVTVILYDCAVILIDL